MHKPSRLALHTEVGSDKYLVHNNMALTSTNFAVVPVCSFASSRTVLTSSHPSSN